jgi:hypothetical protein
MPEDVAQHVEDLLLSRPDLVRGFTASRADGHGPLVELQQPAELVAGHAPRILIRTAGSEEALRAVLDLVRDALPHARIFYWLVPVIAMGRL